MRLTRCNSYGTNLDAVSIQAGKLSLVKSVKPNTPLAEYGIPSKIRVQVAHDNSSWPTDPKSKCQFTFHKKLRADKLVTLRVGRCIPCYKCLKEMGFNCTGDFVVRMAATAGTGAAYAPSEWTEPAPLQFSCVKRALKCWTK